MKKKILYVIVVVAIALMADWNVSRHMSEEFLSDMALANVEALADEENGLANVCCPIWNVSITYPGTPISFPTITCSTGGTYKCKDCACS
ncbi:MAG: NVEALA domain-containing protein [Prevotellaceae bacterium]|jgi:hypothetical protein|nr:NVEALA domain-containing protein [Prevotellaceae bacterium]